MPAEHAFLFDLDGTLVDSVYQHVLAWKEALDAEGIELSVWRIHRKIGMSGVIADFQLLWAKREPANEKPLEPYLGRKRYSRLYPAGSLLKEGAIIVGGSDWDVSSYNPFCAFQTAVTRRGGKGQKALNIDEKIPLTTAVDAYTINAARLEGG